MKTVEIQTLTGNQLCALMEEKDVGTNCLSRSLKVSTASVCKWRRQGDDALKPMVAAACLQVMYQEEIKSVTTVLTMAKLMTTDLAGIEA